jgi:diguanylate cyclase
LEAQREVHQMRSLAETDALTNLYNRAYLEKTLQLFFSGACETGQPLSVIFADLDHFKKINDTYGHQAGDCVLISVAQAIKTALRGTDIAARYGGEEFVCLLPNTPEEGTRMVAERLRIAVMSTPHKVEDTIQIDITASFGCATFSPQHELKNPTELLEEADHCLYIAKREGRNRVISSETISSKAADEVPKV